MPRYIVSVGVHSVYNIDVVADNEDEAVEKVEELRREQGVDAILELGRFIGYAPEQELIQGEGEA